MGRMVAVLAALSVTLPVIARAEEGERIEAISYSPEGDWRLNSIGDGCTIIRDFKAGERRLKFTIQQVHPGSIMQFGIFGDDVSRPREAIEAGFLPADATGAFDLWAEASVGGLDGFVFAGLPFPAMNGRSKGKNQNARQQFLQRIQATEMFLVRGMSPKPLALRTGSISAPLEALELCTENKLADMGLTQEVRKATRKGPTPKEMTEWVREIQRNYPKQAQRSGWNGMVNVRLIVGVNGRVEHCHVVTQMTAQVLREAACESFVQYALFDPAQDAGGNAIRGLYLTAVRYMMPSGSPFSADAHGFKVRDD